MFLECIMVCVDYADFLEHTLPYNKHNFDGITIVTTREDNRTIEVAKEHSASVVLTDKLYLNGDKFNKGKAINDGIAQMSKKDWILITDADMIMPKNMREVLNKHILDINCLYGTSRYMCPSYQSWLEYAKTGSMRDWTLQKNRLVWGVGFFQLVNANSKKLYGTNNWYGTRWGFAGRSDRAFLRSYPEEMRKRLTDIIPIHLESEVTKMGANWNGRSTIQFGI